MKGGVIAIGNFDGVHKGHQILISKAAEIANTHKLPFGVLTFEPHPRQYFQSVNEKFRLTTDKQRVRLLHELCDVDFVLTQKFDDYFASLSPNQFVQDTLISGLSVKHVTVGHDFCYGKMRAGKATDLKSYSEFETQIIDPLKDDLGTLYSSSQIRHDLRRGDITAANDLLGWEWDIEGTVIHGDKRGRDLGYPTANMDLGDYLEPALGIYATRIQIEGEDTWRNAVTNIGIRPMFQAQKPLVESFIFDFDEDIYEKEIKVKPVKFLRGEAKFDSLEALIAQMDKDCENAKKVLV